MAVNQYFNNYNYQNEQKLIDDLVVESIEIHGVNCYYVSRALGNVDEIMNEDKVSRFDGAYQIEAYIKDNMGFQGEGDFLSRFGLQIRDQMTFTVAITSFNKYIRQSREDIIRPREGDLMYFLMNKKLFEITFNEHESVFYQTGALQVYDLKTELYEFSNERFETGLQELDELYANAKFDDITNITDLNDLDSLAKNIFFELEGDDIIDFSEIDPFSEISDIGNT